MTAANRGKYAEDTVRKHLKELSDANINFTFNRNQDAHAAGGRFVPQAGDFQAFGKYVGEGLQIELGIYSRNFIIEVKEVKHASRLPYKNYSPDKVARVRVRERAGTECLVMVCHRVGGKALWRAVPQGFFYDRDPEKPGGSWDLSGFPLVGYKTALDEFLGVTITDPQ